MPPYEQLTMTPCTDPYCPSVNEHNTGAYSFALFTNEEWRTNKLPPDIRDLLHRIYSNKSPDPSEHDPGDYEFLAKFAVVHRSHRKGLMPAEITDHVMWKDPKIVEILREGVGRQPLLAVDKI
ncbi:MAG: hypothetical protein ALECFALPRED_005187 [Alectoria fallacina]|uniref:Uncharacterized protein n=1 Tax=Alectoria fallacina TaxID=1903189 RepID=A0A8H3EP28_9LECA|nr:MAG: hypothetical protein ALECFALPRED_005187 [Alectoria fallacina]